MSNTNDNVLPEITVENLKSLVQQNIAIDAEVRSLRRQQKIMEMKAKFIGYKIGLTRLNELLMAHTKVTGELVEREARTRYTYTFKVLAVHLPVWSEITEDEYPYSLQDHGAVIVEVLEKEKVVNFNYSDVKKMKISHDQRIMTIPMYKLNWSDFHQEDVANLENELC